ncbi:hypothetical protein [Methylomagnum sp.]
MNTFIKRLNDYLPAILALGGVIILAFIPNNLAIFSGGGLVASAIYWHYRRISQKNPPSDSDIDGVYYFGFIITIVTLVFTIFHVAYIKNISEYSTQIITQFGLGLAFTAVALICRMLLLFNQEKESAQNAAQATDQLTQKVGILTDRFDSLSQSITVLANSAQTRSQSLLETFERTETQFNERLNRTAGLFEQSALASHAKLKLAVNELETATQRAQAREQQLETEFNQASQKFTTHLTEASKVSFEKTTGTIETATERFSDAINALIKNTQARELQQAQAFENALEKFNAHLAETAKDSLEKTTKVIGQATGQFTQAVTDLSAEIERLKLEAATLDFGEASRNLGGFIKAMETSLGSIQSAVDAASQNAAAAINKLTAAARDTHVLAVEIDQNLDSLKNLDRMVAQIRNAGEGLDQLAVRATQSGDSLQGLGGAAQGAANQTGQFAQMAETAINSLAPMPAVNREAIESIAKLTGTARETHALALQIAASLDNLKNLEKLVANIEQAGQGLERVAAGAAQSGGALLGLAQNTRETTTASGEFNQHLRGTSTALTQMTTVSGAAVQGIAELAHTTRKTHDLAMEIANGLNILKATMHTRATHPANSTPTPTDSHKPKKRWYFMTMTETYDALRGKNRRR